ncbi:hypothetical protein Nepgr_009415 [Nepenthes gracilis]|uniref:Uncharacterized protein n=1 Tax=Nepenthes gracilis TaxID=150966 RepID=A0AAD3XKB7_NEPGR|nr:hypothetical protein Nepgr_009415 [Nepenthes gracilis]
MGQGFQSWCAGIQAPVSTATVHFFFHWWAVLWHGGGDPLSFSPVIVHGPARDYAATAPVIVPVPVSAK